MPETQEMPGATLSHENGEASPKQTSATTRIFFPNLDGLRFFCFLSVFFFHSFGSKNPAVAETTLYKVLKEFLFANGVLGVNFFYVLSGFLITYLLVVEKDKYTKIKIGNFYVRRILRIWPLYFFCVFFGFVIFPMMKAMFGNTPNEAASLPYYLFFFSNLDIVYNSSPDSSVLAILWSVAIEEQFYLFWPLLLTVCPRKLYLQVFAVLMTLSFLFRWWHSDNYLVLNLHTFSCISDMVVGGIFAVLSIYSTKFMARIKYAPKAVWISLYIAVLILYLFTKSIFHHTGILYAFERLVISVLFALIIVEQCFAEHSFYKMSRFKTISKLGTYTFGLYCLHPIGMLIANNGLAYFHLNDNIYSIVALEAPLAFGVTIALALFSYHFYEKRFLQLKDRFARIRKH